MRVLFVLLGLLIVFPLVSASIDVDSVVGGDLIEGFRKSVDTTTVTATIDGDTLYMDAQLCTFNDPAHVCTDSDTISGQKTYHLTEYNGNIILSKSTKN